MKNILVSLTQFGISLGLLVNSASAFECQYDNRSTGGNAASVSISKNARSYSFRMLEQSGRMNPSPDKLTEIGIADCVFSSKLSQVGECAQREGPRGHVYSVRTSIEYDSALKDIVVRVVVISENIAIADAAFPIDSCTQ